MMCSCVDSFMKNVDEASQNSSELKIYDCYQALTLDTICKIGMGVDFEVQSEISSSKYLRQMRAILSMTIDLYTVVFGERIKSILYSEEGERRGLHNLIL